MLRNIWYVPPTSGMYNRVKNGISKAPGWFNVPLAVLAIDFTIVFCEKAWKNFKSSNFSTAS